MPATPCRRLPWYDNGAAGALAGAEAMLECVASGNRPAIRWYVMSPAALLLGASQQPSAVDAAACRAAGIAVYKRAAGGAAVLADEGMLGLDVVLPAGDPRLLRDLTQSYRWLGEAWMEALRDLGLPATLVGIDEARANTRDTSEPARLARVACFGGLSPFEVTLDGRKVVGLAQVRRRVGALFQAAVLLRWSPAPLSVLLAVAPHEHAATTAALAARVAGLDATGAQPISRATIVAAVESAFGARGLALLDDGWTPCEEAATQRLLAERYQPLLY